MIERVVENWLTRVNERQYQFPFCQVLLLKGFRVLHISSHGPQEQGKDVIAIDTSGAPIAYQLKTGNIDLGAYRKIRDELVELVEFPIQFPGVSPSQQHRAVLVANGILRDTARAAISADNQRWLARGFPALEVILRDELIQDFISLHGRFLPNQLSDVEQLLRLYTCDGRAPLPRSQFSTFILNNTPLEDLSAHPRTRPSKRKSSRQTKNPKDLERHLASAALLASYAVFPFVAASNHWAIFEAWVIFCAHVLAAAESHGLKEDLWKGTFDLAFTAARQALRSLIREAVERKDFLEGNVLVDSQVGGARMTILLGLMSLHGLVCRMRKETDEFDLQIRDFVKAHRRGLYFWGESAAPYLILLGLYLEISEGSIQAEALYGEMVREITTKNRRKSNEKMSEPLSDPYLEIQEALATHMGLDEHPDWDKIDYSGRSYSLRTLVLMLARRLRRQFLASNWHAITSVDLMESFPQPPPAMLLWHSACGDLRVTMPRRPQSWSELRNGSTELDASRIPKELVSRPDFLAAMLTVYPHRLRADTVKLLEDSLGY